MKTWDGLNAEEIASIPRDEYCFQKIERILRERNELKELSDGCGNCHACLVGVIENHMPVTSQRMIVCSDCGNKRCPKASNHRHKCTGSNEVGQYGSIYTAPRELSDEEIKAIANNLTCTPDKNWNVLFAREILKKASEK
jgi:hypothetical protein